MNFRPRKYSKREENWLDVIIDALCMLWIIGLLIWLSWVAEAYFHPQKAHGAEIASCDSLNGCGCNSYEGHLTITWPSSPDEYISGPMFDVPTDDGKYTQFNINGTDYRVQDINAVFNVNYMSCVIDVMFDGDPIFHDGFEG